MSMRNVWTRRRRNKRGNSPIGKVADLIHRRKDLQGARFGRRAVCRRSNDKRSPNTEGQGQPPGVAGNKWPQNRHTRTTAESAFTPPPFSLSLLSLSFAFLFLPFSSWLSTSRSFSNNRYIDHLRKLDVMSSIRESRNVHTYVKLEEEGNRRAIANPSLPYVGCGRPRTSVHPSFMPFEGSPSTA